LTACEIYIIGDVARGCGVFELKEMVVMWSQLVVDLGTSMPRNAFYIELHCGGHKEMKVKTVDG
jgi:hypothetical protein